jgi:hypothetical protein
MQLKKYSDKKKMKTSLRRNEKIPSSAIGIPLLTKRTIEFGTIKITMARIRPHFGS